MPIKNADINFELKKLNSIHIEPHRDIVRTTKTIKDNKTIANLTFKTSSHKTKEVAEFFNQYAPKDNNTFLDSPEELNFVAVGNLTVGKETFKNIVFAQGSSLGINNWWFGGENCKHITPDSANEESKGLERSVYCESESGNNYIFSRGATKIDKFTYGLGAWIAAWAIPLTIASALDGIPADTIAGTALSAYAINLMNSSLGESKDKDTVSMLVVENNSKNIVK
ncbi:hypothetical protein IB633_03800 [Francisella philomiragia]|uniref:Uncharacterized protein n=1 Tax=Francisella philomiragia subsp. philomiragia (strain ATCC 25017 / CCUG 19701 / FSC 153 / O\|nr:hypothetical protein [Francisella philomiragia]AJI46381.1 hypothetical protein BF30_1005 [Francisella philomiragia]AJI48328.1 hypothetical protein KU46_550 [Francisella philomiragia]MBK2020520.1 hypothetical protein [Francisella philomiragia]MBK2030213.1 hypothetical protein [Francisella philomiragia]MBK2264825.1 hypothetical protein [Francisella philomiragia]